MDLFKINAKPFIYDVLPYIIAVYPQTHPLSSDNLFFTIKGRSFINVKNVYLSASNPNIFPNTTSYFNPFSGSTKLSANNVGFYASQVLIYGILNNKTITLEPQEYYNSSGYIDVIVENEAGYGLLSRDSVLPLSSPYYQQKPSVSGIRVNVL
jgi:hypothetical protein